MRIIAGEFRGRRLLSPESETTRPVTDRVKQSLFDILTPLLPDAVVYDCFAGTGSMGLESLSRGARKALFLEGDRGALIRLRKNIETLKVADRAQVIAGDLFKWFRQTPIVPDRADVFFLDPPYRFLREQPEKLKELTDLVVARHLAPGGTLVFRHDAEDRLDLPALERYDERTYGGMTLEFLRPPGNA